MIRQSSSAGPCKYLHNYYIKKRLCKNFAKEKREKKLGSKLKQKKTKLGAIFLGENFPDTIQLYVTLMNDFKTSVLAFYNFFLKIKLKCGKENMLILNACNFQKKMLSYLKVQSCKLYNNKYIITST